MLGLISCTGTNFMIRAEAWQEVDGFPEHTVTEDFAMGIELTLRRWRCIFVPAALAIGEAPETTRKVRCSFLQPFIASSQRALPGEPAERYVRDE